MKIQKLFLNKASLLILATVMCFGLVQVTQAAGAREYEVPPCYDITGSSTPLNVNGVPNGGVMNFDDPGVEPAYQACVRVSSIDPTVAVPVHLEGWVYNSNLGWVSLYCPGGAGAQNLGVLCGNQAYSVNFLTTPATGPDFTSVKLSGYAWGDNVGYISFNSAFHQTLTVASGVTRGLIDNALGAAGYHAWADSVGWLDLRGVYLYWYDTDPPTPNLNVSKYISICSSKDLNSETAIDKPECDCDLESGCTLTDPAKIPDADNSKSYKIKIAFVDDSGTPVVDSDIETCAGPSIGMTTENPTGSENPYCVKYALTWEDDVDFDQTTKNSQSQAGAQFSTNNSGAVSKPLLSDNFSYDAASTAWRADVKSKAPTSDRNVTDGMPNEKFYYADAGGLPGGYDKTNTDQNKLVLKEMQLLFFKYSENGVIAGECIYGEIRGSKCEMGAYVSNVSLSFNPLVEVSKLFYKQGDKLLNFINVGNVTDPLLFNYKIDVKPGVTDILTLLKTGLESGGEYSMKWNSDPDNPTDTISESSMVDSKDVIAKITGAGESISPNAGPYVYSKISYTLGGQPISYFGAKLPRIKAGLLLNPVAKVEGNVYVTDFAQKASDFSIRSLGNIASNLRREAVVRNVAKYLAGYSGSISGGKTITDTNYEDVGLSELVVDKVYYLRDGDLKIECFSGTCTFDKNITFIVENGNIYVKSDIRSKYGNTQVGLIALRDLTSPSQNQGFLYLSKDVGWLQNVQIYLDRLMQSYDPAQLGRDSNGFALTVGDDYDRQQLFNNQLVIEGTISSMNGVGNASRALPVYETGAVISLTGSSCAGYDVQNLGGICRARVADVNYLRYYGPGLELCTGSEGGSGSGAVANVPRDQDLKASGVDPALGCNPNYAGYSVDASNLYSIDTQTDLVPGGSSSDAKQSEYFESKGLPATLQNEYPVNFFYRPISKDLKGFEVDQNVNQIIQ